MKLLTQVYRRGPLRALACALLGIASGLASTGVVALLNEVLAGHARSYQAVLFFGACALAFLTKLGSELWLVRLTQAEIRQLRIELSQKLLRNPLERLEALGKPRLLAILKDDINAFGNSAEWLPFLLINGVIVASCLAYLAWLSLQLLGVLVLLLGLTTLGFYIAEHRAVGALEQVRELKDRLYAHFRTLVEGTKELQQNASRAETFVRGRLAADAIASERLFVKGMTDYALVTNLGSSGFYLIIGVLLFMTDAARNQMEALAGFCVVLLYMVRPLGEFLQAIPALRQAEIALDRIRGLERELDAVAVPSDCDDHFARPGPLSLSVRGLIHRHLRELDEQPFTLGPIDLDVRAGELTFIVGGNGSGKTTLALLLLGLYSPQHGSIHLNGRLVDGDNRHAYRQFFSAVFADYFLFDDWSASQPTKLQERVKRYLALFKLEHKVRAEAHGPSTLKLSSGQRKRLALLSAYLEDRPIYLFDEWAADQDPEFRRLFYTELLPELRARGKAVLAITHDDAYFHLADRVIKLDEGQLHAVSVASASSVRARDPSVADARPLRSESSV